MTDEVTALVDRLNDLVEGPHAYFEVIARGAAAVLALDRLLRGPATTVYQPRLLAADALTQIGDGHVADMLVDALTDCLDRPLDPVLRESENVVANRIAENLGNFDLPHVRDVLLGVLREHPYSGCVRALARFREARAAPLLAHWLGDDMIRGDVADALQQLGLLALAEIVRVLVVPRHVAGLEPPIRVDARVTAAKLLATIASDAVELPLAWALGDEQVAVRRAAAHALVEHDAAAADIVVPIFVEMLASDNWLDRESATGKLRTLGPVARPALSTALAERSLPRDGELAAVGVLLDLGAIDEVAALHAHPDRHVRWAAVDGLAKHPSGAAQAALALFAHDRERAIRERARP